MLKRSHLSFFLSSGMLFGHHCSSKYILLCSKEYKESQTCLEQHESEQQRFHFWAIYPFK